MLGPAYGAGDLGSGRRLALAGPGDADHAPPAIGGAAVEPQPTSYVGSGNGNAPLHAGRPGTVSRRGRPAPAPRRPGERLSAARFGLAGLQVVGKGLADGSEVDKRLPQRRSCSLLSLRERSLRFRERPDAGTEQVEVRPPLRIEAALAVNVGAGGGDGHGLRMVSTAAVTPAPPATSQVARG